MHNERMDLTHKMMALEFAAVDLNLFLDTHPDDEGALADYNDVCEELRLLRDAYERKYGPTLNFGLSKNERTWQWVDEPWPWQVSWK